MPTFFQDFGSLLPDTTITITPPGAPNNYGEIAPGIPFTCKGRAVSKIEMVVTPNGENVQTTTRVYLNTTTPIPATSTVTLPSSTPERVVTVEVFRDETNAPFYTLVRF